MRFQYARLRPWPASILASTVLATGALAATEPAVRITKGPQVHVSGDVPDRPHVEPYVAADLEDPSRLVAGAIAFTRKDGWFTCATFHSQDGGKTWQRVPLAGLEPSRLAADPWVAFDEAGRVFLSCLRLREDGEVVVYRSEDGGRSWSSPATVPLGPRRSFDHPVLAVDTSGEPGAGTVYIAGIETRASRTIPYLASVALSRSTDHGETFSSPDTIWPSSLNLNVGGACVLSDGTVVVVYFDFQGPHGWIDVPRLWALRFPGGEPAPLPPYFVSDESGGYFPSLAVGSSGDLEDRLFLVWTRAPRSPESILLSVSSNGGETWSRPARVSDGPETGLRRTPAVAVSRQGAIGVSWWDDRNATSEGCWDIYFSASTDGGRSFAPSLRITPETFCPGESGATEPPAPGGRVFDVARRWPTGGDYMGLTAAADGRFHLMWADTTTGVYQLWTTAVTVEAGEASSPDPETGVGVVP